MTDLAEWTFRVEAGKIAEFARAVGADVSDVATPTFTMVAGADWVARLVSDVLRLDGGRTVHGEQAYDYHAPIRAGMTLTCKARLVSDVAKPGRAGPMRVVTVAVVYSDAATGADLVHETMTTIETAGAAPKPAPGHGNATDDAGHTAAFATFGPVTRTDLVRYAGASGDFNPLHLDPDFARAAGLPDVIAHGMYSAGLVASAVERRFGMGAMAWLSLRFRAPVWVGDRLALTCDRDDRDLTLTLRRGTDTVLSATARLAAKGP